MSHWPEGLADSEGAGKRQAPCRASKIDTDERHPNPEVNRLLATAEAEHKVEGRLLLDVVVREGAAVLELLAGEDQALLVGRDALLVLDLGLHVLDRVRGLDLERDGFTCGEERRAASSARGAPDSGEGATTAGPNADAAELRRALRGGSELSAGARGGAEAPTIARREF